MKFIQSKLLPLTLSLCLLASATSVAEDSDPEYQIKAGYVYNFIKFITWPTLAAGHFNICLLGDDPFGALINPIENRTAFGLPIKLRRLGNIVKDHRCHIVFIGAQNPTSMLDKCMGVLAKDSKTLVVGEGEDFAEQGGMVGFINRDGRIKLNINLKSLHQSGLMVSAKLLEIAEIVGSDSHD